MDTNLSLYHIFHIVAQKENISQAAKDLYISQPAISKSISKLEKNLDTNLFIRGSRGVTLTEEGKALYEHTSTAFQALDQGKETIKRMTTLGIGHIRIGVSTTLCKYLLLPYLKDFVKEYPHIKITIDCQSTFHTMDALEDKKIDIGLIGKPDNLKNLNFYSLGEIEDIFIATKTYIDNLIIRETNNNTDILSLANLMLLDEENITRIYVENYFKKYKIDTSKALEVSSMDLLIEFAKIGLGVACVIKKFVQAELDLGTLIEIPVNVPIPKRHVGFAYSKNVPLTDSMKKFIQFYQ
jgi:DNA-binding transcriptional LysR family regulator